MSAFQLSQHVTLPSLEEAAADIAGQQTIYSHKWPFSRVKTDAINFIFKFIAFIKPNEQKKSQIC